MSVLLSIVTEKLSLPKNIKIFLSNAYRLSILLHSKKGVRRSARNMPDDEADEAEEHRPSYLVELSAEVELAFVREVRHQE